MPTSGPHTNFNFFLLQNAENIALSPKLIFFFVGKVSKPPENWKNLKNFFVSFTALWVLKWFGIKASSRI